MKLRQVKKHPQYAVSKCGKVVSFHNEFPTVLLPIDNFGYERVWLDSVKHYVHRLIAEAWVPNPSNNPIVNHRDGNKANNNTDNLHWCTYSENNQHAIDIGLRPRFTPRKLDSFNVRHIRTAYHTSGCTQTELAKQYGVANSSISQIVNYVTWRHVQ